MFSSGKYNLTDFLETLLKKKIEEKEKSQILEFSRKYGAYFQDAHHEGFENLLGIFLKDESNSLNNTSLEILFGFLKYLPSKENILVKSLSDKMTKIKEEKALNGDHMKRRKASQ